MSKNEILKILEENDGFVSGEEISGKLGVSRAAVWKAIKLLRQEGYVINSRTNRGYKLESSPQVLDCGLIGGMQTDSSVQVVCVKSVDSTNNALKKMALDGAPEGMVLVADHQTSGRGRLGRSFVSPKGKGVYMSILLKPEFIGDIAGLTCMTAVAVINAIEKIAGTTLDIKWTNDILLAGKKLCGILTELSTEGESGGVRFAIIGIGVNVNQEVSDFPPELREKACSLYSAHGVMQDRNRIAGEIVLRFFDMYRSLKENRRKVMSEYRKKCVTIGNIVAYTRDGKQLRALAETVDFEGALVVRKDNGQLDKLRFGEVSIVS
ncbi:MAG: biotin--[acetyl-CoA-carboxylase] ligase [Clostridiales bacterium]|jgi:BirA family biotin operon repressor/biotin-[acetyl-CoA-carboxylase] ligase|nr:biotin--[acetyl-CoA-carboxylase] ligase [Clostridiales bacterium]